MSTELTKQAAAQMRDVHEREDVDDLAESNFYLAVAEWLQNARCSWCLGTGWRDPYCSMCEDSTCDHECPPSKKCEHTGPYQDALVVARAYLGGES